MFKKRIFYIVLCAVMCAFCAVISQIAIPTPLGIPLTLQTFIFSLIGYVLGIKYGLLTAFLYVLMGAIGLPVFYGFRGGISAIFGDPTGGFIIGFLPLTMICGIKSNIFSAKHGRIFSVLFGFLGVILCHLCGVLVYTVLSGIPFYKSALIVSLPFILKDFALSTLAYFLSGKIIKLLKRTIPEFK
jgi:biotin transport system substrate-specific component